jgi:hypothetical protein
MVCETAPTDQSISKSVRSAARVDGQENDAECSGERNLGSIATTLTAR